mgnify:CR=1 FL=1
MQHERGPRTSTIRKQVALYFRGHKEESSGAPHFPATALPAPAFFTAVSQLEPHGLELAAVAGTPERQALVGLAQPTPKVSPKTLIVLQSLLLGWANRVDVAKSKVWGDTDCDGVSNGMFPMFCAKGEVLFASSRCRRIS